MSQSAPLSARPDSEYIFNIRNNTLIAYKLSISIRTVAVVFATLITSLLAMYIIFFVGMQDRQWYDWLRLSQIFVVIALLILLAKPGRVLEMFNIVLVLTFLMLVLDIIALAYINPLDINNMKSETRKNVKEILLIFSVVFVIVDASLFLVSIHFGFVSPLSTTDVKDLYVRTKQRAPAFIGSAVLASVEDDQRQYAQQRVLESTTQQMAREQDAAFLKSLVTDNEFPSNGQPGSQNVTRKPPNTPPPAQIASPVQINQPVQTKNKFTYDLTSMYDELDGPTNHTAVKKEEMPDNKYKNN